MFLNQSYSNKCDIWSIGVIYFELLFGIMPGEGENEIERIKLKHGILLQKIWINQSYPFCVQKSVCLWYCSIEWTQWSISVFMKFHQIFFRRPELILKLKPVRVILSFVVFLLFCYRLVSFSLFKLLCCCVFCLKNELLPNFDTILNKTFL